MEVGLMHWLCRRMLHQVQYSTGFSVAHSQNRARFFFCPNWKIYRKEKEVREITRYNSRLAWKLNTIMKGKFQKCFSVSGKTTGVIVLRKKENKMKSSWMLHNINRILGAIHSSARSLHKYKSSECKFAEDFIFNSTSIKVSNLARNKILWREYMVFDVEV